MSQRANEITMDSERNPTAPTPQVATEPPTKKKEQPVVTFYQRPLPSSCTALSSAKGKKIFASALANGGLRSFFALIEQSTTQSEPAYCGLSTLVLVLNALSVDPQMTFKGPWRWYEERMLNCCMDLELAKEKGITLPEFQCLAHCQGLSVDLKHCNESTSEDDFREAVTKACAENGDEEDVDKSKLDILVISYSRKVLGQTGSGHFSPIAAYDADSDNVLILDTARFKYGPHWVKLPLVFEAMRPKDPDSGKSRGFALLSFPMPACQFIESQPVSQLFRTKMDQSGIRSLYKSWLVDLGQENVSFSAVLGYWTKGGSDWGYIWEAMDRISTRAGDQQMQKSLIHLIGALSSPTEVSVPASKCKSNGSCCVRPQDAIFVMFLASLNSDRRAEIIASPAAESISEDVKSQLLCEANLIASAIEISDQIPLDN